MILHGEKCKYFNRTQNRKEELCKFKLKCKVRINEGNGIRGLNKEYVLHLDDIQEE